MTSINHQPFSYLCRSTWVPPSSSPTLTTIPIPMSSWRHSYDFRHPRNWHQFASYEGQKLGKKSGGGGGGRLHYQAQLSTCLSRGVAYFSMAVGEILLPLGANKKLRQGYEELGASSLPPPLWGSTSSPHQCEKVYMFYLHTNGKSKYNYTVLQRDRP